MTISKEFSTTERSHPSPPRRSLVGMGGPVAAIRGTIAEVSHVVIRGTHVPLPTAGLTASVEYTAWSERPAIP